MLRVLNSLAARVDAGSAPAARARDDRQPGAHAADRHHRRHGLAGRLQRERHPRGGTVHRSSRRGAARRRSGWSAARAATSSCAAASTCGSSASNLFQRSSRRTRRASRSRSSRSSSPASIDAVYLVYNEFKSMISQRVVIERLLPMPRLGETRSARADGAARFNLDYDRDGRIDEGSRSTTCSSRRRSRSSTRCCRATCGAGLPRAARVGGRRARRAHDGDGRGDAQRERDGRSLTLYMNKVRQAAITREIIEIVSGRGKSTSRRAGTQEESMATAGRPRRQGHPGHRPGRGHRVRAATCRRSTTPSASCPTAGATTPIDVVAEVRAAPRREPRARGRDEADRRHAARHDGDRHRRADLGAGRARRRSAAC